MALFARQRPRSKRVLLNKVLPGANGAEGPALESRHLLPVLLIWGLLLAATVALIHLGDPPLRYTFGDLVTRDVYARADFRYPDEAKTERLRTQAADKVLDVYREETDALVRTEERLDRLLEGIQETTPTEGTPTEPADGLKIPQEAVAALKTDLNRKDKSLVRTALAEIFKGLSEAGLVESDGVLQKTRIRVMGAGSVEPVVMDTSGLLTPTGLGKMARQVLEEHLKRSLSALTDTLAGWLEQNVKPTLVFDLVSTNEDRARARQEIPLKEVNVTANDPLPLFPVGTRIESLQLHILAQEQRAYLAKLGTQTHYHVKRLAGITLMALLVYGVGLAYLVVYRHRLLRSPGRLAAMVGLLLLMVTIARLCVQLNWSHTLVPVSLLTIGLALAHGRRFALIVSVFALVPVTVTLGNDYSALVVLLMGVLVAALLTVHINKRTKLIVVGFMVGLAQVAAIWAIGLLDQTEPVVLLRHSLFGMGNGLFVGFLVTGTLPFLERAFHITTDISLLELADLNQPILKSLALEAPGTYNHSLTVGVLAEAAAEAIGADDMLVRVGSYYHDVGKLNKPEYFIENSNSALYRHENLSPTMSTLIIIAHVKDGLEMAEDLGLPHAVRDIIAQHHGTTLVEFFYKKHQEEQTDGEELDDSTFRYPGPKPKTREAAVVMLADAAESASRTLSEPSPGSLETLVDQIIQGRLNDGQFSECNITLGELHRISQVFVKGLNSIYHSRIRY